MSIFEDLKKNLTEFTENAAKKSSQAIEIQKLKMRKTSLESDLRDCYVALGRLYEKQLAQNYDDDSDEGKLIKKIASVRKSMLDIEEELRTIKGVIRCANCGSNISSRYEYCPKCGAMVPESDKTSGEEASDDETADDMNPDTEKTENENSDDNIIDVTLNNQKEE